MVSNSLLNKEVLEQVRKIVKYETVIVAVSGGPDSICLLKLILGLKPKKVVVSHVNYNLREKSHTEKNHLLKEYSNEKVIVETLDIKESPTNNTQHWARKIRFDFFVSLANKYKTKYVFVGTTNDDLIESYFLREIGNKETPLFRLSSKYNGIQIERPLVFTTKKCILEFLHQTGIHYFVDETNRENIYLRNIIRNKLGNKVPNEIITKAIKVEHVLEDWLGKRVEDQFKKWQTQNYKVDYILHLDPILAQELIRQYLMKLFPTRSLGNKVKGIYSFIIGRKYYKKFQIEKDKFLIVKDRILIPSKES